MSTEQKPSPAGAPKSETNALATGLTSGWDKFKQGKLISYPIMALILVLVTGAVVGWWIWNERQKAESAKWVELDGLVSPTDMEKYAEKYPNTIQAKLAKLEVARTHLGPEGIDRMSVRDTDIRAASAEESARKAREERAAAVANVEKAREEFTQLADDFKNNPVIRVECLYACAKAEAALVGIPKEGQADQLRGDPNKILDATQHRGDPAKAIEWLDKVAEAAPDTDWGKDAKKLADVLRNQNTKEQVITLQASLFKLEQSGVGTPPTLPNLPFDPSKMPKGAIPGQ